MGKVATSPLPPWGSPPLQSGGQNQKWPINGQGGYLTPSASGIPSASERGAKQKWPINGQGCYMTPVASGIPTASQRGTKSKVAHKWAKWLHHPCRLGDPHRFKAGGKIRSGPLMGKVATSPLPPRGSPPLQCGGQNQKWPIDGQVGYVTRAASGIPTASERGAKSEVAHKWARWLHHPCRLGDPLRFRAGGQNQMWPINGQGGYITPAASGISSASERGAKSEVAHRWARWLHQPCRLGDPLRFRAGGKIRSGP